MSLQSTGIQLIVLSKSFLGITPFTTYYLITASLSSAISSSNYSNDIVGFEEYPLSPPTMSL